MSKKKLTDIIKILEDYLIKINAPIIEKLGQGIDSSESLLLKSSYDLPPDVLTLYRWKNGTNTLADDLIGNVKLFSSAIFIPIERAIEIQRSMTKDKYGWDVTKFTLFESGGGEYFLIDCDIESASYEMIFFHSIGAIEFDRIITMYDSLDALFLTICQCFSSGAYFYEGKVFKINNDLEFEISKKINLKSAYWKLF
jgi:hypothetical protein